MDRFAGMSAAMWFSFPGIAPGDSTPMLTFSAVGLPGIATAWYHGDSIPSLEDSVAARADLINDLSKRTRTVGIDVAPTTLRGLVSRLHTLTDSACTLAWFMLKANAQYIVARSRGGSANTTRRLEVDRAAPSGSVMMPTGAGAEHPDTNGARGMIRGAIDAVVATVANDNKIVVTSEHVVVDLPSFLRVIGIDTTNSSHWNAVLDGLGARASRERVECPSNEQRVCPMLYAISLTGAGNHSDLVVGVSWVSSVGRKRGVRIEMHVFLTRTGEVFHVDSVKYGKMT
jgi:hypothetical protein